VVKQSQLLESFEYQKLACAWDSGGQFSRMDIGFFIRWQGPRVWV
jgi:hypothetical protein